MNKVIIMGRLTRDPQIRWTQGQNEMCIARFTVAVDRRVKQEGQQAADFPACVAFGKTAEFVEKFGKQGVKFLVTGRITTGSYTDRDGKKVYTTEITVEEIEFAESKGAAAGNNNAGQQPEPQPAGNDGFMDIPDGIDDELPFN